MLDSNGQSQYLDSNGQSQYLDKTQYWNWHRFADTVGKLNLPDKGQFKCLIPSSLLPDLAEIVNCKFVKGTELD